MKKITINNKEYTLTFSIEATLYNECTISVMDMFLKGGMIEGSAEDMNMSNVMENLMVTIADMPRKALTLFYAALLEHHGSEGDKSVLGIHDAKTLLTKYISENGKSFRDVFGEMMDLMADDSFFDLIGLNQITGDLEKSSEEQAGENTPGM